jgi:hypothetical protein
MKSYEDVVQLAWKFANDAWRGNETMADRIPTYMDARTLGKAILRMEHDLELAKSEEQQAQRALVARLDSVAAQFMAAMISYGYTGPGGAIAMKAYDYAEALTEESVERAKERARDREKKLDAMAAKGDGCGRNDDP